MPRRGAVPFKVWQALSLACAARDNYRCVLCGKSGPLQSHHVLPRSQGGADELGNLVSLDAECHAEMDGGRWKLYRPQFEAHLRGQRRPVMVLPRLFEGVLETSRRRD